MAVWNGGAERIDVSKTILCECSCLAKEVANLPVVLMTREKLLFLIVTLDPCLSAP